VHADHEKLNKKMLQVLYLLFQIAAPRHAGAWGLNPNSARQNLMKHITIPTDIQEKELSRKSRSKRNRPHHTSEVYAVSARLPNEDDLRRAADILNTSCGMRRSSNALGSTAAKRDSYKATS